MDDRPVDAHWALLPLAVEYDYGLDAQKAAEERLAELDQALADNDDDAVGLYCGCETCMIREVLEAAWPALRRAAYAEFINDVAYLAAQEMGVLGKEGGRDA